MNGLKRMLAAVTLTASLTVPLISNAQIYYVGNTDPINSISNAWYDYDWTSYSYTNPYLRNMYARQYMHSGNQYQNYSQPQYQPLYQYSYQPMYSSGNNNYGYYDYSTSYGSMLGYPTGDTIPYVNEPLCNYPGYGRYSCYSDPSQRIYDYWTGTWY